MIDISGKLEHCDILSACTVFSSTQSCKNE